ncbi:dihydrofolate reductase family protein [Ornithinimicrobium cavernae]|uniref:dihydrofolate reductase family protein n=1 Tax=Ornithinimicrobium cavernae TaxID=2666047 RepID=UPI000D6982AD|nr:dihydrofolate reductase family protein [Ornithinimicrobium cavernae]
MSAAGRLRLSNFAISLDGFGTGEGLTQDAPFGHAGERLHEWMFATAMWHRLIGEPGGTTGLDNELAGRHWEGFGAEIMGRGKFHTGPGPIPEDWRGFWGEEPPFRTPVIVLTHHTRPDLEMAGGTRFLFRDTTPQEALAEARELAGGQDVRLGGGVRTVREFLDADLVDELHVVIVPILLGRGQRLWDGQEALEERFDLRLEPGDSGVMHLLGTRRTS